MCQNCGCARPDDDGPDHDRIPGGTAEAAVLRAERSIMTSARMGGSLPDRDADAVLAPTVAPRLPPEARERARD